MANKRKFKGQEFFSLTDATANEQEWIGRVGEVLVNTFDAIGKKHGVGSNIYNSLYEEMVSDLRSEDWYTPRNESLILSYVAHRREGMEPTDVWKQSASLGVRWGADKKLLSQESQQQAYSDLINSIASLGGSRKVLGEMSADELYNIMPELFYNYDYTDIVEGEQLPMQKRGRNPMTWFGEEDPRIDPEWGEQESKDLGALLSGLTAISTLVKKTGKKLGGYGKAGAAAASLVGLLFKGQKKADTPENLTLDVLRQSKTDILSPTFEPGEDISTSKSGFPKWEDAQFDISENLYSSDPDVRRAFKEDQVLKFSRKQYALQQVANRLENQFYGKQGIGMSTKERSKNDERILETEGLTLAEKQINFYIKEGQVTNAQKQAMLKELYSHEDEFKKLSIEDQISWGLDRYLLPGGLETGEDTQNELWRLAQLANRMVQAEVGE